MITKKQAKEASAKWKAREMAKRAERIVITGYPADHNPYLAHEPIESCYAGCRHVGGLADGVIVSPDGTSRNPYVEVKP